MKLSDIVRNLDLKMLTPTNTLNLSFDITSAYVSDLLSELKKTFRFFHPQNRRFKLPADFTVLV